MLKFFRKKTKEKPYFQNASNGIAVEHDFTNAIGIIKYETAELNNLGTDLLIKSKLTENIFGETIEEVETRYKNKEITAEEFEKIKFQKGEVGASILKEQNTIITDKSEKVRLECLEHLRNLIKDYDGVFMLPFKENVKMEIDTNLTIKQKISISKLIEKLRDIRDDASKYQFLEDVYNVFLLNKINVKINGVALLELPKIDIQETPVKDLPFIIGCLPNIIHIMMYIFEILEKDAEKKK